MALPKQSLNINFAQGLDTKTDPFQVPAGKFLELENTVFTTGSLLQKRKGFNQLQSLSDTSSTTLATFNGNLLALGTQTQILSADTNKWYSKGPIQPLELSVVPAVRTDSSQTTVDMAVAPNMLACAVWIDSDTNCYYQIVDSETGEVIVSSTELPSGCNMPRVFSLGSYFIITFIVNVTGTPHLRYIAIPTGTPDNPGSATDLSTLISGLTAPYDGVVANNFLYLCWNGSDGGGALRTTYLSSSLTQFNTVILAGQTATLISLSADTSQSTAVIWAAYWRTSDNDAFVHAYSNSLVEILPVTQILNNIEVNSITAAAFDSLLTVVYATTNTYSFSGVRSDYLSTVTCTQAGVVGTPTVRLRSVNLASKAFYFADNDKYYVLAVYAGAYQPTYFLIDLEGNAISKLAYGKAFGYPINQLLPQANVSGNNISIGYLFKDLLVPVNKESQVDAPLPNIYTQNGINIARFNINNSSIIKSEIGANLHLTGGFIWMYDGAKPVEHSFHVWPEDLDFDTASMGGDIEALQYYYYVTYEWTDAQGNIHRSAPSVPLSVDLTGAGTSTSVNTIHIPTYRITYKTAPNEVKIVVYRWSTAQPIPYQVSSVQSPLLNDTTVDSVDFVDDSADSAIIGNLILYTFGGVVENIAAPASSIVTLYKSRLLSLDSEDPNTIWFSKQVIQGVPVEMNDLFTLYVAPTISAQGSTGPSKCLAALDDKIIIWKRDAIYYITGNGPDNTGASNDFSDPIFITSTVGCSNQNSIVFIPQGLMFQSDKGIWLLGRDLSSQYIGAPVERYNDATVLSALNVPGTNQVRFTLDTGITLMYDYYYNQWGTFTNIPAISSVLYENKHTYLNEFGQIFQESDDSYLDGSRPVLMSFTTGWFNLAGLQGFERAYFFYLLGQFITPHNINIQLAFDYNPSPVQSTLIRPSPSNFSQAWGGDTLWGGSNAWGGNARLEQYRVFLQKQKIQAFQITLTESFDSAYGVTPGAGFTLSGLNLVISGKKLYTTIAAEKSVG